MTVSSSASNAEFPGNGTTTVFPLPFRFFDNDDIKAYLLNDSTGDETALSLGINYTLVGAGEPEVDGNPLSTLTMLVAPASGFTLVVERIMDPVQETDIINQARFFPEIHENVFDRIIMLIQQGFSGLSRALVRPVGKNYYDAQDRQIKNLADPTAPQDAATQQSVQEYVGSVINSGTGPINLAQNVIYVDPYGVPKVVQDMSGPQGTKLNGFKQTGTNTKHYDIYEKTRREIELHDYVTGGADDTVQFQNMLADIPNKTTSRLISIPGITSSYSGTTPRVIVRAADLQLSGTLAPPAYLRLEGEMTLITMNNPLLDIFSALAYQWEIEGFVLIGGRRQIDVFNDNINSTMIDLRYVEHFLSGDFAINTRATGGVYSHLSAEFNIYKSRIMACHQAINNCCDSMTVKNSWIQPSKNNMSASTPVMMNRGATALDPNCFTRLKVQDTFLIPDVGVEGVDRVNNVRWVDNYGSFEASHSRFGGENGGMSILWQQGAPNTAFPWNVTEAIFKDCALYSGPDSRSDSCVIGIQGQVPNRITVHNCTGHLGKPLVANLSSTNIAAYMTAFEGASGRRAYEYFKIDISDDINDLAAFTPLRPTLPNDLYPYLIRGRRTLIRKQTQSLSNAFAVNLVSFSTITADNLGAFSLATPTLITMPNGCSKMTVAVSAGIATDGAAKTISVDIVNSGGTLVDGFTSQRGINPDTDRIPATFNVEGPPGTQWSIRIRHNAAAALNLIDCQVKITCGDQAV